METTIAHNSAPQPPPHPQFCDSHGARHPADHPTDPHGVVGCGFPLPAGTYDTSWIENHPTPDGKDFYVRVHGRIVPGGYTCERCGSRYIGEHPASL